MRRNGVQMTGCAASAYSRRESSMRSSQRNGELQLMSEMRAGVSSIAARPPCRISAMRMTSLAFSAVTTLPWKNLSVSVAAA